MRVPIRQSASLLASEGGEQGGKERGKQRLDAVGARRGAAGAAQFVPARRRLSGATRTRFATRAGASTCAHATREI